MLYWLGVYTLVAIVALVPFFLLYVLWFLVWLSLTAIRFMIRSVNNGLAIRTDSFSRENWNPIHRRKPVLIHATHRGCDLRGSHRT